jgi:putative PIN family toxin of toxin-antitoxin system
VRVFLDTNVLAAGFATRGLCSDLIREILENHEWVCSDAILAELQRILTKKFKLPEEDARKVVAMIRDTSELSLASMDANYAVADTDDHQHLSAAENAACDAFVTGDKALWVLNPLDHMAVLSPREFWVRISDQQPH